MIWHRFLKPCATAAFICGFAQIASASSPAEPWTVSALPAKSANGISYCSLKTTFADGPMLVFAQDAKGSNSIALDTRKDTMEVGRQYNVTLNIGSSVTRQTAGLAATRQVVIMQMGADPGFFNAVKRKNALDFALNNKKYSFNLDSSVAEGLVALSDCAASLDSGHTFATSTIALGKAKPAEDMTAEEETKDTAVIDEAPAPRKQRKKEASADTSLNRELEVLRAQNKMLVNENLKIRKSADAGLEVAAAPVASVEKARVMEQEMLQEQIDRLKAENEQLAVENQKIKGEMLSKQQDDVKPVIDTKAIALKEAEQAELRKQIDQLRAENEQLAQNQTSHQEQLAAETEKLRAEQQRIEDEAAQLRAENERLSRQQVQRVVEEAASIPEPPTPAPVAEEKPATPEPEVKISEAAAQPVPVKSPVAAQKEAAVAAKSYRWMSDDIYGAAQDLPVAPGQSLVDAANAYIQNASGVCHGEFGQKMAETRKVGNFDIIEAEITCLDGQNDAAAALLFVSDNGSVGVITQEGTVEQLSIAMQKRDRLISDAATRKSFVN